jgi:hypothetical protein
MVADKMKDVWGFDSEGELRTMWRRTGHESLWDMGGKSGISEVLLTDASAADQRVGGGIVGL